MYLFPFVTKKVSRFSASFACLRNLEQTSLALQQKILGAKNFDLAMPCPTICSPTAFPKANNEHMGIHMNINAINRKIHVGCASSGRWCLDPVDPTQKQATRVTRVTRGSNTRKLLPVCKWPRNCGDAPPLVARQLSAELALFDKISAWHGIAKRQRWEIGRGSWQCCIRL